MADGGQPCVLRENFAKISTKEAETLHQAADGVMSLPVQSVWQTVADQMTLTLIFAGVTVQTCSSF